MASGVNRGESCPGAGGVASRRYAMRFAAVLALSTFFLTSPAWAYRLNDRPPDSQELAKLEAKAAAATPRDQP